MTCAETAHGWIPLANVVAVVEHYLTSRARSARRFRYLLNGIRNCLSLDKRVSVFDMERMRFEILSDRAWKFFSHDFELDSLRFHNSDQPPTWADFSFKIDRNSLYVVVHGGTHSQLMYVLAIICLVLKRGNIPFEYEEI